MRKEERKRKETQIRRLKNYQRKKKAKSGSSEAAKRLEIPEACSTIKKRLRQHKGKSQKNTRNRGWACPS